MEGVVNVAFSADGGILASASADGTLALWGGDDFHTLAWLGSPRVGGPGTVLFAFHPSEPLLALLAEDLGAVQIYRIDVEALRMRASAPSGVVQHQSAKVVLVGEANVGKSWVGPAAW